MQDVGLERRHEFHQPPDSARIGFAFLHSERGNTDTGPPQIHGQVFPFRQHADHRGLPAMPVKNCGQVSDLHFGSPNRIKRRYKETDGRHCNLAEQQFLVCTHSVGQKRLVEAASR